MKLLQMLTKTAYLSRNQLNQITEKIKPRIEEIYDRFHIAFRDKGKLLISYCAIHGGDNPTALNLYHQADIYVHFKCRTHHCEDTFGNTLISFIRGLLSHSRYNWTCSGDRIATFQETIEWIQEFLASDANISNNLSIFQPIKPKAVNHSIIPYINIPSTYFINRGYSKSILIKHQVGDHDKLNRAVVPIFNSNDRYVGWTGRSIYKQCVTCEGYHKPGDGCKVYSKWHHRFERTRHLYNFNYSQCLIFRSRVIIIVESPGNLWKLEEASIYNTVALLGCDLTTSQENLIIHSGAMAAIILMDPDKAGQEAAITIHKKLKSALFVQIHKPPKDIDEMSKEEINMDIGNLIRKTEVLYYG